ncbi:hypothetical protein O181_013404, partial [Austropuccinia psidii MF-1]|nr:hypothetical protein [Austropuccinia psidii MF-1]
MIDTNGETHSQFAEEKYIVNSETGLHQILRQILPKAKQNNIAKTEIIHTASELCHKNSRAPNFILWVCSECRHPWSAHTQLGSRSFSGGPDASVLGVRRQILKQVTDSFVIVFLGMAQTILPACTRNPHTTAVAGMSQKIHTLSPTLQKILESCSRQIIGFCS